MALRENFSQPPSEELHRHFRNSCIDFKKAIMSSKAEILRQEGDRFIHTTSKRNWHPQKKDAYHKEE